MSSSVSVGKMPVVESERIPVEINQESGFPFDDSEFERDRSHHSFRSQLDDIAKRHPEFAEHLNFGSGFPSFRSHTLGRHRRGSDADHRPTGGSHDTEFNRYRHSDRPFGSRFEHFGFPFDRHFEDVPDFYEPSQSEQQSQQDQPESPQPTVQTEKPPPVPQQNGRKKNIQQSNTVDLGQKQDPVDENRGQRSMSAPPENRSTGQRFVSSINIPIQRPGSGGGGDMGNRSSQPETQNQQTQTNRPNERVIPIHVEGRDEPVIPKNVNTTYSQPSPPQPQPDRIFGRTPSHFTQFLNKGDQYRPMQEDLYRQQQQQQQEQQQTPPPVPQPEPEQQPQPVKSSQLDQIQNIQKDVSELMNQVEKFNGKPRDKDYLYLDEMLTRNLIKLDNIETEGKDNIRQARKEAIKCIEGCIGILEAKANANAARESENIQPVEKTEEEPPTQPEVVSNEISNEVNEPSSELISSEQQHAADTSPTTLEVSGIKKSGTLKNVPSLKDVPNQMELKKSPTLKNVPNQETVTEVEPKTVEEGEGQKKTEEECAQDVSSQVEIPKTEEKKEKKEKKKGKKKEKTEEN